jgi:hypothetical protein
MIINGPKASSGVRSGFISPLDREGVGLLEDFQRGGYGIGDTTESHYYTIWKAWLDGNDIYCQREDEVGAPYLITSAVGITEISFCFDQLMRPYVAYVASGQSSLYYFDTIANSFVVMDLPGVTSPKLTLDDKSKYGSSASDVTIFYMRSREVQYRLQRDRFGVEYVFAGALPQKAGVAERIGKLGMDRGWRLRIEIFLRQDR